MVNIGIRPASNSDKPSDMQSIKLEPEQASRAPFPPGCVVAVLDQSSSYISCSGEVTAVYVKFARNSGLCDNCYEVSYVDPKGRISKIVVNGNLLRYGLNCPIYIASPDDAIHSEGNKMIEGFIKGFELHSEDDNKLTQSDRSLSTFLYTVEVSAAISNNFQSFIRQRGIGPENIHFRPKKIKTEPMLPNRSRSAYLQVPENTSVVSFDETSTNTALTKDDYRVTEPLEIARLPSTHQIMPSNLAVTTYPNSEMANRQSFQEQTSDNLKHFYRHCTPLACPVPTKFQGDIEACKDQQVPEFSLLCNFPLSGKTSCPPGMRCCVMCGLLRWVGSKGRKNHSSGVSDEDVAFIPGQNKGLCTLCDVSVWVVNENKMQIKWCKGCKNFQTWAAFGDKGSATKCVRCRTKQKEKYAMAKNSSYTTVKSSLCGEKRAFEGKAQEFNKRICE